MCKNQNNRNPWESNEDDRRIEVVELYGDEIMRWDESPILRSIYRQVDELISDIWEKANGEWIRSEIFLYKNREFIHLLKSENVLNLLSSESLTEQHYVDKAITQGIGQNPGTEAAIVIEQICAKNDPLSHSLLRGVIYYFEQVNIVICKLIEIKEKDNNKLEFDGMTHWHISGGIHSSIKCE